MKPELKEASPELYNKLFGKGNQMKTQKPYYGVNYRENKAG